MDTIYTTEKILICGYGTIKRKWKVTRISDGVNTTCEQIITINALHEYNICFPKDVSVTCSPESAETVLTDEIACDILSIGIEDKKNSATGSECYQIARTFTVLNWCTYDDLCGSPEGAGNYYEINRSALSNNGRNPIYVLVRDSNRDQNEEFYVSSDLIEGNSNDQRITPPFCSVTNEYKHIFRYTQIIKVFESTKPVEPVVEGANATFYINEKNCLADVKMNVTILANCDDNPTLDESKLKVALNQTSNNTEMIAYVSPRWSITALGAGKFEVNVKDLPLGTHDLIVVGKDACNNFSPTTRLSFSVSDSLVPTPICRNAGLSVNLSSNGQGGGSITLQASAFIASKIYDCNGQGPDTQNGAKLITSYSINRIGESADKNKTSISLTCTDQFKTVPVEIHAWDELGNHNFCQSFVEVQDNQRVCPSSGVQGSISGKIRKEDGTPVPGVKVYLLGGASDSTTTNASGDYSFQNLSSGSDYSVYPQLNINPLEGVSTYDLVLIQKHILNVKNLNTPYTMIAADVNNSTSINTLDLIALRKLILGIDQRFVNNSSWRFADATYVFTNQNNPWSSSIPEVINISSLNGATTANFVAIKIGDVGKGTINSNSPALVLDLSDASATTTGQEVCQSIKATNFTNLLSVETTIQYNSTQLDFSAVKNFNLSGLNSANFSTPGTGGAAPGSLKLSWNDPQVNEGVSVPNGTAIFEVCFTPKANNTSSNTSFGASVEIIDKDGQSIPFNGQPGTITVGISQTSSIVFKLSGASGSPNSDVCIDLTAANFKNVVGMQLAIKFDPALLTHQSFDNLNAGLRGFSSPGSLSVDNTTGIIRISWEDPQVSGVSLPDNAVIVRICFRGKGNCGTSFIAIDTTQTLELSDVNQNVIPIQSTAGKIELSSTATPNIAATITKASTPDASDGAISLTVSGGQSPYIYQWAKGETSAQLSKINVGQYCVTVTDQAQCQATACFTVEANQAATACRAGDSLALVSLFNATDGPNWTNKWDLVKPMSGWYGVTLSTEGCVTELDLDGNQLSGPIPNFNLPSLTYLSLSINQLSSSIPNFNLPNLTHLLLSFNQLSGNIPNFNLPNLEVLLLDRNYLDGAIPNFNMPKLNGLRLENNQLNYLPKLNKLYGIESPDFFLGGFSISSNKLTFDDIIPNYDIIQKLDSISLVIERNLTSYAPQDSIYRDTTINSSIGQTIIIDLGIDPDIGDNRYSWLKNDIAYTTITGNNKLTFSSIKDTDAGVYRVVVTNPQAPQLTLYSRKIRINVTAIGTLQTSAINQTLCKGDSVKINFSSTVQYQPDNVFQVELSESSTNFNAPIVLGSIKRQVANPITLAIPTNFVSQRDYFYRVVSSNPRVVSPVNPLKVKIESALTAPIVKCGQATDNSIVFNWEGVAGATGYQISNNTTNNGIRNGNTVTFSNLPPNSKITLEVQPLGSSACPAVKDTQTCATLSCAEIVNSGQARPATLVCNSQESPILLTDLLLNEDPTGTWSAQQPYAENVFDSDAGIFFPKDVKPDRYRFMYTIKGKNDCPSSSTTVSLDVEQNLSINIIDYSNCLDAKGKTQITLASVAKRVSPKYPDQVRWYKDANKQTPLTQPVLELAAPLTIYAQVGQGNCASPVSPIALKPNEKLNLPVIEGILTLNAGDTIRLRTDQSYPPGSLFVWTTPDTISSGTDQYEFPSRIASKVDQGRYTLIVRAPQEPRIPTCLSEAAWVDVQVVDQEDAVLNIGKRASKDTPWSIEGLGDYPRYTIKVFNRWGALVFQANSNYLNQWHGTCEENCNGKLLPQGTYYYLIEIPELKPIIGAVYVLR
ncbi:cellulosome anchoring protein cohesin region [Haliscomenobacter hydrossis DSM 1100]|uniref:Cellulosome anchoring protein cohesin region n=2 Tax=Haliscomenobacter TaxID=2349 RepID=F4KQA8_HALH1|nr:cellulosome anchoring protein cohesin region [Haliscomenobacter hydrossis DSM 1100]